MTLRLSECDYEFLRPPKDVFNVKHTGIFLKNALAYSSDHYIRHGEGKKSVRKIFSDVKMNEEEQKKLKEFEELIVKEKVELPSEFVLALFLLINRFSWNPVDTFRFMYSGKLDLKKSLKVFA